MVEESTRKITLNTTVRESSLIEFRDYCKKNNQPMNVVLETFMTQFSDGQYEFKFDRERREAGRAVLSTTIRENILNKFKDYCKDINCTMGSVLDIFMMEFANGMYEFKLIKNENL